MSPALVHTTNVNAAVLAGMFDSFSTAFNKAYTLAESKADLLAMRMPSSGRKEIHSWLGGVPNMKQWVDERQLEGFSLYAYELENIPWEATLEVDRDDILDDQMGGYGISIQQMGYNAKTHPDILLAAAMAAGFSTACYDGSYFFATDHPYVPASGGAATTQANTDGGSGTAWYLLSLEAGRPMKPFIHQVRKEIEFVAMDRPTDENAFMRKKYLYGVDDRRAVGYGFYQQAWGSKQTLATGTLATAYAAMIGMLSDKGLPLGLTPTHLVVPPSLWSIADPLINNQFDSAGASNPWYKRFELVTWPYLATT
ncbi:MAG: Mu-like prophage major head subunit gpT family protein [Patescibacteria group bacterium]